MKDKIINKIDRLINENNHIIYSCSGRFYQYKIDFIESTLISGLYGLCVYNSDIDLTEDERKEIFCYMEKKYAEYVRESNKNRKEKAINYLNI